MFFSTRHILTSLVVLGTVSAQWVPDKQSEIIRELEHVYLDSGSSNLIAAVSPCSTYTDPQTGAPSNNLGRQSAAEWIRTAFHDFITATIFQTGGIDASIGFETTRDENVGPAFADSLTRFSYYFNNRLSMSDMIALGVVMATGACGGPHVVLRGGRVDATQAGPTGVPQPQDSLATQLAEFASANFNQDDTIALTACGHTMGGVHRAQFPNVVAASAVSSTNTDGRQDFDETVAGFDVKVVTDYVHWTGDKGGPLVTTSNTTTQSDLRLYSSDQNQTVNRLVQSSDYFSQQCADVFQRMIETVPGGTSFTTDVSPTTSTNLKPHDVYLVVDWKGNMVLTGYFRYVQVSGAPVRPSTLTIGLVNRAGKTTSTTTKATASTSDTGSGIWGPTNSFQFTLSFSSSDGLSGITANGQTFKFQDTMFVIPTMSSVSPKPPTFSTNGNAMSASATYSINTTVAYLPGSGSAPATLTATFAIPVPQTGTVSPKIDTSTTTTLKKIGTSGPFTIYSAVKSKQITAKQGYGTSVDVAVPGSAAGLQFYKPFIQNP